MAAWFTVVILLNRQNISIILLAIAQISQIMYNILPFENTKKDDEDK